LSVAADDPGVIGRAAMVLGRFGEDIHAALALIDRALVLNPSFAQSAKTSSIEPSKRSAQRCAPVAASISCAVIRTRAPAFRTEPSST
jgi:hypothetical protein